MYFFTRRAISCQVTHYVHEHNHRLGTSAVLRKSVLASWWLSVRPSVCLSIYLSIYISIYLSICLSLSVCLFTYLTYEAPSHLSHPLQLLSSDVQTPLHSTLLLLPRPTKLCHVSSSVQYYSWQSFPCHSLCMSLPAELFL